MFIRSVDLNLLPVLRELLRERNVSRAAGNLGLSQSATSAALARLRKALNDPLLVQIGRRMELTDRARGLIGPVEAAIEAAESVWLSGDFDPASARRHFVIATADHAAMMLAPAIIAVLRRHAPGVTVQFVDMGEKLFDILRHGEIDFAILPLSVAQRAGIPELRTTWLFNEEFVAVVGEDHPLAKRRDLSTEDCIDEPHVVFKMDRSPDMSSDDRENAGYQADIATTYSFQQFSVLPFIALESGTIALVQRRLAEKLSQYLPIKIVASPIPTTKLEVHALWSPLHSADRAHQWFLGILKTVAREGP